MSLASHHRKTTLNYLLGLWVVCETLWGIDRDRRVDQLHHTKWTLEEGAPSEIHALAQTTDGFLWIGASDGLFRFDGVGFDRLEPRAGQQFEQRNVYSLLATADGGLWVGFWSGGASFIKD